MQGQSIPPVFLKKAETDTTFEVAIVLDKATFGKTFVLENIYYDLAKYNIRTDAADELDKLVTILKDNPTLKIELSSHTDVRASDAYNSDCRKTGLSRRSITSFQKGLRPIGSPTKDTEKRS